MSDIFYWLGSRCFRIGNFIEHGFFRVGNVTFFLHDSIAFGVYRDNGQYAACFLGPVEIVINEQTKD